MYKHYHKNFWCHKQAFKYFKGMNLLTSMGSTGLVFIGTIIASVTLNPIILGSIRGSGVLFDVYNKTQKSIAKLKCQNLLLLVMKKL